MRDQNSFYNSDSESEGSILQYQSDIQLDDSSVDQQQEQIKESLSDCPHMLDVINEGECEESQSVSNCNCHPRILVVDDTPFNILAVKM
jgi:CheY-like chemotaxis protein